MNATTATRKALISQRKIAGSNEYMRGWIGTRVVFTTWEGERIVGTIERFEGVRPVLRFADGRWAFGSLAVEIVS